MRELFRGIVAKEWVSLTVEIIECGQYNKVLEVKGVNLHRECQNQRCDILHDPSAQKKYLQKDIKATKNESRSETIENLHNYVIAHPIKEEDESVKNMSSWVKSVRIFKKNTKKSGQQGTRNLLIMSQLVKNEKHKEQ